MSLTIKIHTDGQKHVWHNQGRTQEPEPPSKARKVTRSFGCRCGASKTRVSLGSESPRASTSTTKEPSAG